MHKLKYFPRGKITLSTHTLLSYFVIHFYEKLIVDFKLTIHNISIFQSTIFADENNTDTEFNVINFLKYSSLSPIDAQQSDIVMSSMWLSPTR